MNLGGTFNNISKEYHLYRPNYPDGLIREIFTYLGLKNPNILEIGCGTGKATLPFLKMGAKITAVDPGDKLIKIAKKHCKKYPQVKFFCQRFEDFADRESTFDLIFAAQAFHWINPKVGLPKVKKLLKPDGHFIILRNDPKNEKKDKIGNKIDKLLEKYAPELFKEHPLHVKEAKGKFEQFEKIREKYFTLEKELFEDFKISFSGETLCKYLDTTSILQLFNERQKREAFREIRRFLKERGDEYLTIFQSKAWIYKPIDG